MIHESLNSVLINIYKPNINNQINSTLFNRSYNLPFLSSVVCFCDFQVPTTGYTTERHFNLLSDELMTNSAYRGDTIFVFCSFKINLILSEISWVEHEYTRSYSRKESAAVRSTPSLY